MSIWIQKNMAMAKFNLLSTAQINTKGLQKAVTDRVSYQKDSGERQA